MKALIFTDLHLSDLAMKKLRWKTILYRPDLLICAGDITIFEEGLDLMLEKINKLNKKTLIIHGNHEDASVFKKKCEKYKNLIFLHKQHHKHNDCLFFGYGGGGFSLTDPGFYSTGEKFSKIIKKKANKKKKKVFITHAPPYDTQLDLIVDHHCGNKTLRNFDIKNKIDIHICGHLHENFGRKDNIKDTKVINPGPYGKLLFI